MTKYEEFKNRCDILEQCLPESDYRAMVKKLHDEMLDEIKTLQELAESQQNEIYGLLDMLPE